MTRVIEKMLFRFDELSDSAKEKARDWWRNIETQDCDLLDSDDYKICADILGIEFDTRPVKLMGGGVRYEPKIHYSGFSSQGDGASFEGRYAYAKQAPHKIRAHAPQDTELHRIADCLYTLQKRNFYRIKARVTQGNSGTMHVETCLNNGADTPHDEEAMAQLMRDFADWIYAQLRNDWEWRMSDEQVDESIIINEYEFDENGRRTRDCN